MKNIKKIAASKAFAILLPVLVLSLALAPQMALAQNSIFPDGTEVPGQFTQTDADSAGDLIVNILQILLSLVGLVAVVFLVWGAFKYMASSGDEERVKAAKSTMINALIGLVIVLLSYAIVQAVANLLQNAG